MLHDFKVFDILLASYKIPGTNNKIALAPTCWAASMRIRLDLGKASPEESRAMGCRWGLGTQEAECAQHPRLGCTAR